MSDNLRRSRSLFAVIIVLNALIHTGIEAQVKITDGSVFTIDSNSLLEMESSNKGLLIPRVAISSFTATTPLTAPVPEGMLVYSRNGLIPDGFYFWNGSKWVSMGISEVPVLKAADCTLLKTETLVVTSGDITLTLPVITPADNGLSITVKNTGTHTNLVVVKGSTGSTIDGSQETDLMRWQGNTFIAWNGNWISENKINNKILEVSPSSSFTTIAEAVAFLNIHMNGPAVVQLCEGDHEISSTQTIDLPWPVTFEGISYGGTKIKAAGGVSGNPLFVCISESYFKMLTFEAISNSPGNDAIRFTGSDAYHEVKDAYFSGFNKALVSTTNNDLWIFEVDITDCSGSGLEIAAGSASGGQMRISETDFFHCAIGINLLSGVSETISIVNCTFYNRVSGSDIGVLYHPDSFTSFKNMMIANNGWNNEGTLISGFDFSRPDGRDADAFLISNTGEEDAKPHFKLNVVDNGLITDIVNAGTYYKAQWTNNSTYQSKWNISGNKSTYLSTNSADGWAVISGNLSTSSQNRVVTIAIVKNGETSTRLGETSLRIVTANQPFQFSTVIYIPELKKNDYLELFVTSNNSVTVTFQDVHWFTNTQ